MMSTGKRYRKCKECRDADTVCYITDYGEVYHSTPGCAMLRRNVMRVPLEECRDRNLCKKCGELRGKEHDKTHSGDFLSAPDGYGL